MLKYASFVEKTFLGTVYNRLQQRRFKELSFSSFSKAKSSILVSSEQYERSKDSKEINSPTFLLIEVIGL